MPTDPTPAPTPDEVKSVEELLAMGGKFYPLRDESYCDTPLDTWRLDLERGGYVRVEDDNG